MDYKFTKLSLRAKIIAESFADLKKAYSTAGTCEALAERIKDLPFENFKLCYDFGEDEIRDLIHNCSISELSKSVLSAVGGFHRKGKMDCFFTPAMGPEEFENFKNSNLEQNLVQNINDRVLTEFERKFIVDGYARGEKITQIHNDYLSYCENIESDSENKFKPITLNAMYQVIHRERSSGNLKNRQLDWEGDLGSMAIWLKVLEKKTKSYGHLKRVNDSLNSYYQNEGLEISYVKLSGFFDQPKTKKIIDDLERDFDNSNFKMDASNLDLESKSKTTKVPLYLREVDFMGDKFPLIHVGLFYMGRRDVQLFNADGKKGTYEEAVNYLGKKYPNLEDKLTVGGFKKQINKHKDSQEFRNSYDKMINITYSNNVKTPRKNKNLDGLEVYVQGSLVENLFN